MKHANTTRSELHIKLLCLFVIVGLVLSGVTAFPLLAELNLVSSWLVGGDGSLAPDQYTGFRHWVLRVREGFEDTYAHYPFMGYGTDWLAFAHISIAMFFIPVYLNARKYIGNIYVGIITSVLVIPIAMICGQIRGIPIYWRLIDSSFGVVCAVPLIWILMILKRTEASDR